MEIEIVELKDLIKRLYNVGDRTSVIILGEPGIGKSEIVKQLAKEIASESGKEFIEYTDDIADEVMKEPDRYFIFCDIRLTEVEPADLIGIPRDDDGHVRYKPLLWAKVMSACAGILFLDEITNVQRLDVQAAMYKLLLDRKVGFVKLNDDVLVVGAGNKPEHSVVATNLPAPVINRVRVFITKAPRLEQWAKYMDEEYGDWDRRVYAFLMRYRQFFVQRPDNAETLNQYATPRAWTRLALVSHKLEQRELEHVAIATVGTEAGAHFQTFVKIKLPELSELIERPEDWSGMDIDTRYFASLQIASELGKAVMNNDIDGMRKMKKLIDYLMQNDRESVGIMLALMSTKEKEKLYMMTLKNQEFRNWFEEFKRQFMKLKRVMG